MNKELEALEKLWNIARNDEFGYNGRTEKQCNEFNNKLLELKNIIEKGLQRLESIDNSKPSETMKCLESMKNRLVDAKFTIEGTTLHSKDRNLDEDYSIIKNYILKAKEQEKALEIIKEKCLTNCNLALVKDNVHYEKYCKEFMKRTHDTVVIKMNLNDKGLLDSLELLTEEEFELLKRYLS